MEINHFRLALSYSNVIFLTFIFLTFLNPFGLDHTKYSTDYPMLNMNSFHKMEPLFAFIETTWFLIILIVTSSSNFMLFSDSTHYVIPKPVKNANSDSSPFFILMNPLLTKTHHKMIPLLLKCQNTYYNLLHLPQSASQITIPPP